ncbi:MAG: hypothetical protein J0L84_05990 [Verrucomicrobia bacterium]|nr:hypothetical protein [Verrucomicrobiota bacterium]
MEDSVARTLALEPRHAPLTAGTPAELASQVFAAKVRCRRWLTSLSVEEKYRRLLALQRMVWETRRAAGKPCPTPWPDLES